MTRSRSDAPARQLWEWAREILKTDEVDSRQIRAAVLILACYTGCGPRLSALRQRTNIPMSDVNRVSYYLRKSGIWGDRWFRAEWIDDESRWPFEFALHVLVATGEIICRDGEFYQARTVGSEFGIDCAVPWSDSVKPRPLRAEGPLPRWLAA